MNPVDQVIHEAAKLLKRPGAFCRGHWFSYDDETKRNQAVALGNGNVIPIGSIDTNGRQQYEALAGHLKESGASLGNPTFQVCGQGALAVASILCGHDHDTYLRAQNKCEETIGGSIPDLNDSHAVDGADMAIMLTAALSENPDKDLHTSVGWVTHMEGDDDE